MPKPTSAARVPGSAARVVLITMDTHLASAAQRSAAALQAQVPGLSLCTHSASAYRADPAALARCLADIARADIVIVAMLFMEDHFLPVLDALKSRREACDAMVCIMSAPPVMQSAIGDPTLPICARGFRSLSST